MIFDAYLDDGNCLHYNGEAYPLTPSQAIIMDLLLAGRAIRHTAIEDALWPLDSDRESVNPWATIKVHIHHLRQRTPLRIRNICGVGYILEESVPDPKKTRPVVEQTIKAVRGALKESSIRDSLVGGPVDISDTTGIGKSSHSTDDCQIDIIVTPKETAESDD